MSIGREFGVMMDMSGLSTLRAVKYGIGETKTQVNGLDTDDGIVSARRQVRSLNSVR
jgi:hypothetical protein